MEAQSGRDRHKEEAPLFKLGGVFFFFSPVLLTVVFNIIGTVIVIQIHTILQGMLEFSNFTILLFFSFNQ